MPAQRNKPGQAEPVRLLIVDDHEVVRLGLRAALKKVGTIRVVGEAESMASAIQAAKRLKPDAILLDLCLPDGSGVQACREILAWRPETQVLFLTTFADEDAAVAAILAGAKGYVLKEIGSRMLIQTIHTVARGQCVLDPAVSRRVLQRLQGPGRPDLKTPSAKLSPQEDRVLALVAAGKTNKEIADDLGLREKTVKNYLTNVFQKLHVSRRIQAAKIYLNPKPGPKFPGP